MNRSNSTRRIVSIRKAAYTLTINITRKRHKRQLKKKMKKIYSLCHSILNLITKTHRNYMGYIHSQFSVKEKYKQANCLNKEINYRINSYYNKYKSKTDREWHTKTVHLHSFLSTILQYTHYIVFDKMFDLERKYYARKLLSFLNIRRLNGKVM